MYEGTPLPQPEGFDEAMTDLIRSKSSEFQFMDPGEYDVTPEIWTRHNHPHNHDHSLTVLDNGESLYTLLPRYADAGLQQTVEQGGLGAFRQGGIRQPINPENPLAVIAGGHPLETGIHIFGIVAYLGRSSLAAGAIYH